MGWGTLGEVRDELGDPPGGQGRVEYTMGSTGWVGDPWGGLGRVGDLSEGQGRVEYTMGSTGRVKGPLGMSWMGRGTSWRSGKGRGTLREVQDWLGDFPKGPGRVGGHSRRSGTVRETIGEVRNGLGDPWGGPGRVGGPPEGQGRVEYTMGSTGWVGDPWGGLGRVGGPFQRSRTGRVHYGKYGKGRGTLGDVLDGSGNLVEVRDG